MRTDKINGGSTGGFKAGRISAYSVIFLVPAAILAFAALSGCSSPISVESKGWTRLNAAGDTITAQCNFERGTMDIDGRIIHISRPASEIAIGKASVKCDAAQKLLMIQYKGNGKAGHGLSD